MPDMYSDDELADTRQVIDWIAAQSWCNGRVGMFGTSWGGTASLQAAVDAPGPLRAVLANCATADRFEDDIHWMGGALLTDSFEWGATLPAILAAPPDAATVGDAWWGIWQERLRHLSFPLDAWIRNPTRSEYWRHGSARFSTERLSCPILAIGGWADRYSNSVMGLVQARPDLCWGIVGPWGHHYPDQGEPGPAIGFQEVALAWWDHWLKGSVGDVLDWPRLRLWRRQYDPPRDRLAVRNGEWIEIADPAETHATQFFLSADGLSVQPSAEALSLEVPNDLRHGECAGDTGYFGRVGGLPLEQSADDARALCFDSAPLDEDLDLIGHAEFACDITRDLAQAQLVCRVCEVAPDGRSHLVTRQILNLALDQAMDSVSSFSAGEAVRYRLRFPSTAYRFSRGHRIRLALGTSYWPLVWPAARPAVVRLSTGPARLSLTRPDHADALMLAVPFPKPRELPPRRSWESESAGPLQRDRGKLSDDRVDSSWRLPKMTFRYLETGVTISFETTARYRADTTGSYAVSCTIEHTIEISRPDGTARMRSSLFSETKNSGLTVEAALSVFWNAETLAQKAWRYAYSSG
jgi:putative CocE/NonD family hydrolase